MVVKLGKKDILNAITKKIMNISMYVLETDVHHGVIVWEIMCGVGDIVN